MYRFKVKKVIFYDVIIISAVLLLAWGYKTLMEVIYPIKYEGIVSQSSKKHGVEEELIYAIIKAESGFNEDAQSKAGACGLMQITPDTFEWLQLYTKSKKKMGEIHLNDPEVNINYGTMFISMLRKKYGSDDLVLSAYNAGPRTVERWLKDEKISKDGEELRKIPYKETQNYVKRVKQIKKIYKKLYFE